MRTNSTHPTVDGSTFISARTFCASRKAWFTLHARARIEKDVMNYATQCATKMKAKVSHCD